jgi:2-aminoadipate transaminase
MPIDDEGLDTDRLEQRLADGLRPKACYVVPHFHNPTGATMGPERRCHLDRLALRYGFVIIDDDPYRELHHQGTGPVSDRPHELTVRLRSTSKALAPGLRVGAISGPRWLLDAVVVAKQGVDLHTSTFCQAIAAEALAAPWFAEHVAGLRKSYGAKCQALVEALGTVFGDRVAIGPVSGGMFAWVRFDGIDTAAWLDRCLDAGVCFVPGPAFAVDRDLASHARLSFATASVYELRTAVDRMAAAV